jgi:hypothetical protein
MPELLQEIFVGGRFVLYRILPGNAASCGPDPDA